MGTLYLIRHGTTILNEEGKIRAWSNPPLDAEGERLVHELADRLKKDHIKVDILVSSDLDRSVHSAKVIGKALGVDQLHIDWHFRPWNLGIYAGQQSKKVHPELMKYIRETPNKKVPEGESFNEFDKRFMTALESLLKEHENGNVMIVTHHRGDRIVAANLSGSFDPEQMNREGIPPAGMVEYRHKGGKIT